MPRRRTGKKIDFTHWTGVQEAVLGQVAGSVGLTVSPAAHESETLLRFRGHLICYVDGLEEPATLAQIAVGMLVVPEGTGTTVLSAPATNPDTPWFWYEIFCVGYEEYVVDTVDSPGISSFRAVIDSKAMRIVRNQEIQMVVQNVTLNGAVTVNTVVTGRFLSGQ